LPVLQPVSSIIHPIHNHTRRDTPQGNDGLNRLSSVPAEGGCSSNLWALAVLMAILECGDLSPLCRLGSLLPLVKRHCVAFRATAKRWQASALQKRLPKLKTAPSGRT
jgi:hypothetical protein